MEKKLLRGVEILKLRRNKVTEDAANQETSNDSNYPGKKDVIPAPEPSSPLKPKPDFNAIYDELHSKFPQIINMREPVLLEVGIRKELSKETGISAAILYKWIPWYCRKSNYYAKHKQGATRFRLDGSEADIVTEKQQENMDEKLKKAKSSRPARKGKNTGPDDNQVDSLSS